MQTYPRPYGTLHSIRPSIRLSDRLSVCLSLSVTCLGFTRNWKATKQQFFAMFGFSKQSAIPS